MYEEELDNEHLAWCKYLKEESYFRYQNILTRELKQKLDIFEQILRNQEMRKVERNKLKVTL